MKKFFLGALSGALLALLLAVTPASAQSSTCGPLQNFPAVYAQITQQYSETELYSVTGTSPRSETPFSISLFGNRETGSYTVIYQGTIFLTDGTSTLAFCVLEAALEGLANNEQRIRRQMDEQVNTQGI